MTEAKDTPSYVTEDRLLRTLFFFYFPLSATLLLLGFLGSLKPGIACSTTAGIASVIISLGWIAFRPLKKKSPLLLQFGGHGDFHFKIPLLILSCGLLSISSIAIRFFSGDINALDFAVFFDWPAWRISMGDGYYIEMARSTHSWVPEYREHCFLIMEFVGILYKIWSSPWCLHILSSTLLMAGAFHIYKSAQILNWSHSTTLVSLAAFSLNDVTTRTINFGFHPEQFYIWLLPALVHSILAQRILYTLSITLLLASVKEDSFMHTIAITSGLACSFNIKKSIRHITQAIIPIVITLITSLLYILYLRSHFFGTVAADFEGTWINWGAGMASAGKNMILHPLAVTNNFFFSNFITNVLLCMSPLIIIGWRWWIGIIPIAILYANANPGNPMQDFGIYYAYPFIPALTFALGEGLTQANNWIHHHCIKITNSGKGKVLFLLTVLSLAISLPICHGRGYTGQPFRKQTIQVKTFPAQIPANAQFFIQGSLLAHIPYDHRAQLLSLENINLFIPNYLIVAPSLNPYPLTNQQLEFITNKSSVIYDNGEGCKVLLSKATPQ